MLHACARARASLPMENGASFEISRCHLRYLHSPFHCIPFQDLAIAREREKRCCADLKHGALLSNNTRRADTPLGTANISEYRFMQVPG